MIRSWKPHGYSYLPTRVWMSCYNEIITSVSGLPTLLVVSTRAIGSGIIKTKQHSLNHQKTYPLFYLETPLLQVSSDITTSGINSSMKIQQTVELVEKRFKPYYGGRKASLYHNRWSMLQSVVAQTTWIPTILKK